MLSFVGLRGFYIYMLYAIKIIVLVIHEDA